MALSAMAPTEKGEHFIYASFPISLSLLIAALVTTDPAGWLTIVGIISPLGTILLYELGLDERLVKWHYSRKVRARSEDLKRFIVASNIILQSWDSLLQHAPSSWSSRYFEGEVRAFIKQTISSFPVRRRLWRIRGTIYLGLSIVVLVPTGMMLSIDYLNIVLDQTAFFFLWIVSTLILNGLIAASNSIRHSGFVEHMVDLVQYFYMQVLIAEDSARNPREYVKQDSTRYVMKSESTSLDIVLFRGDWSVFHQRWSRFCRTILNVARRDFETEFGHIAFKKWAVFVRSIKPMILGLTPEGLQFSWFIVISTWARSFFKTKYNKLFDFLSIEIDKNPSLITLENANLVLDFLPRVYMNEDEEEEKSRTNAVGSFLSFLIRNSEGSFNDAVKLIIDTLMNDKDIGIHPMSLARIVMQYAKETHNMHEKHAFPNEPGIERLRGVMEYLMEESNAIYVVIAFLQVTNLDGLLSLLVEEKFRTLLFVDEVYAVVQKKSREMRQEKTNETRIRNAMKELANQREKYLHEN